MPRYVLLRHECPATLRTGSHWDLMLEHNGVLQTWALTSLPQPWAAAFGLRMKDRCEVNATRLPDHRLAYLEYEGPISGDRGTVSRVAEGSFQWIEQGDSKTAWRFLSGPLTGRTTINDVSDGLRLSASIAPDSRSP